MLLKDKLFLGINCRQYGLKGYVGNMTKKALNRGQFFFGVGMSLLFVSSNVFAFNYNQDAKAYKKSLSRRPGASLSEQTHKLLTRAQEDLNAGAVDRAFKALEKLKERTKGSKGEHAQVVQALGYAYAQKEDNDNALKAFEETLELDALPETATLSIVYIVGQLYAFKGNHKKTIEVLNFYTSLAERPSGQAYAMLAGSYYETGQKAKALTSIQKAIDLTSEPKESWLAMAVSLYFANEKYAEAAKILKILVAQNPGKETYWKQWAQSHLSTGQDKEGLVAMEMAIVSNILKDDKEISDATSLMMSTELPYKAAQWMEKKLSDKAKQDPKNLKKLASAYMLARENKKAIEILRKLHNSSSPEVRSSIQLGQILLEEEKWDEANKVFKKTTRLKPDEDQEEQIYLGLGVSYYNLGDAELSRKNFIKIADKSEAAQSWLKFIQSESPEK